MWDLRAYLVLGRLSNLSTIWSNIFCAWIIAGGQSAVALGALLAGGSLIYTAGMFLNDVCDADYDAVHRPERPIPAGRVARSTVKTIAAGLALVGFACVAWLGWLPATIALVLLVLIALYNRFHKGYALAPLLMASCRGALYFMAAAAAAHPAIDELLAIAAGVIFVYVCGVTFLARDEATAHTVDATGLVLLLAPLVAAFYYRLDLFDELRAVAIGLLGGWIGLSFLKARASGSWVIGRAIGPLLAAIPLVDLLTLSVYGLAQPSHLLLFASFFALAVLAQRTIPAS